VKKLRKDIFIRSICAAVLILFIIRLCWPGVTTPKSERALSTDSVEVSAATESSEEAVLAEAPHESELSSSDASKSADTESDVVEDASATSRNYTEKDVITTSLPVLDFSTRHRIFSVPSYHDCFPDVQDVQIVAAKANGVPPVEDRAEAERRKSELVYVGANPYYEIDARMNRSIPYLVPRASHLLQHIGRRFLDSLAVKQIPLHKIIVTSVLRTEDDVRRLKRINGNVSEQSCHRFGTTFDISYNRFHTVSPPDEPERRVVRNDSLKFVLSEVLRDVRAEGRCYIKYEVKQSCFHITVR